MAEGFRDALDRWKKRGCPGTSKARHIELCRKKVFTESDADTILINLNKNLYPDHEGMIFAEGSEFNDLHYVHLKIRDCRVELSIKDFKELADAVQEAGKRLKEGDICALLQKA